MSSSVPPTTEAAAQQEVPASAALVRRVLGLLALVAVLVLVVSVLPGLQDVRERFHSADPAWLAVTFASVFASMLSYVAAVRGTLSRRPGWRASWNLGMAEQGSNVLLPTGGIGGPALGAVVLRRAGVPSAVATDRSAALLLLTSGASFIAIALAGTVGGLGFLAGGMGWVGTWLPAALAVTAVSAVAMLARLPVGEPSATQGFAARWSTRLGALLRDGVHESFVLLRARDPLVLGGCAGYLGFAIAALAASFQAFGGEGPPLAAFVLAFTLGQVGALLPTPGGLGGTEGGLIGMFVLYGAPAAPTAAAVLAYRVFQLGLPALFGLIAFGRIRRRLRDADLTAEVEARFRADPQL